MKGLKGNQISSKVAALFEGLAETEAVDNFLGEDQFYDDSFVDQFSGNDSIDQIKAHERTLTIVIANTTTVPQTAIVFGAFAYPGVGQSFQPGFGGANGCATVNVKQSSHDQVRAESQGNPFHIKGWKLVVNTGSATAQFSNDFTFNKLTMGGGQEGATMSPLDYRSVAQQLTDQIDAPEDGFDITGADFVTLTINPLTTISWQLTMDAHVNQSQFLRGKPVVKVNNRPVPGAMRVMPVVASTRK